MEHCCPIVYNLLFGFDVVPKGFVYVILRTNKSDQIELIEVMRCQTMNGFLFRIIYFTRISTGSEAKS